MRLVIVSNRLPTIVAWEDKQLKLQGTAGGLVSGLGAWLTRQRAEAAPGEQPVWVGWPGATVPASKQEAVRAVLEEKHAAVPVFLPQSAMDKFYLGFCNRTIWPLFHYFTSLAAFDPASWDMYREVNETFLKAMKPIIRPGDVIWIHDYHLMLLPAMLRKLFPHHPIGFFLHIPFPSYEIFRLLPSRWRNEILEGLLGADVIGFHTHDYCRHFIKCVRRALGLESDLGRVTVGERTARVDTFPMGIDYELFTRTAQSAEVCEEQARLETRLQGLKTVLSVDRLDYSKGIPHRLRGYATFLEQNPSWHGRVTLAMVTVPSRIGVDHYQAMKREIDELVGEINGRFGNVGWTPIRYQYRMLGFAPLLALYKVSDVALVTPLRDGMNLVAKEYVAARLDRGGVLVLSEMAGASQELSGALTINPSNPDEIAAALRQALEMPQEEQVARSEAMQAHIRRYDVHWWADDFLRVLNDVRRDRERIAAAAMTPQVQRQVVKAYAAASRRLLLLNYDGTLAALQPLPKDAAPGADVKALLARLASHAGTRVAIVSGRSRTTLQEWFGDLDVFLAAEDGAALREPGGEWTIATRYEHDWKSEVRPYMQAQAERLAGAFVEEKDFGLVWHFRNADRQLGDHRAREIVQALTSMVAGRDLEVRAGRRQVEVRRAGIDPGTVGRYLMSQQDWEFVLAAGDSEVDEQLMRGLPPQAWTIMVAAASSCARFTVPTPAALLALLGDLRRRAVAAGV